VLILIYFSKTLVVGCTGSWAASHAVGRVIIPSADGSSEVC